MPRFGFAFGSFVFVLASCGRSEPRSPSPENHAAETIAFAPPSETPSSLFGDRNMICAAFSAGAECWGGSDLDAPMHHFPVFLPAGARLVAAGYPTYALASGRSVSFGLMTIHGTSREFAPNDTAVMPSEAGAVRGVQMGLSRGLVTTERGVVAYQSRGGRRGYETCAIDVGIPLAPAVAACPNVVLSQGRAFRWRTDDPSRSTSCDGAQPSTWNEVTLGTADPKSVAGCNVQGTACIATSSGLLSCFEGADAIGQPVFGIPQFEMLAIDVGSFLGCSLLANRTLHCFATRGGSAVQRAADVDAFVVVPDDEVCYAQGGRITCEREGGSTRVLAR